MITIRIMLASALITHEPLGFFMEVTNGNGVYEVFCSPSYLKGGHRVFEKTVKMPAVAATIIARALEQLFDMEHVDKEEYGLD